MLTFRRLRDLRGLEYHPDEPGDPAWYWRNLDRDVIPEHVVTRCVHGAQATLGKNHRVAIDGTVTPSLVWPGEACCQRLREAGRLGSPSGGPLVTARPEIAVRPRPWSVQEGKKSAIASPKSTPGGYGVPRPVC